MTSREKWTAFLGGENVGPMVSPLVDDWCLDTPYVWPYDEPDPCPVGHPGHGLSQQMAMAKLCGYDPLFLCGAPFVMTTEQDVTTTERMENGRHVVETRTETPFGWLVSIVEKDTWRIVKPEVQTEDDYPKALWLLEERSKIDVDESVRRGRELLSVVGDKGMVGNWWTQPTLYGVHQEERYYHLADYPQQTHKMLDLMHRLQLAQLAPMRKMGFDYLFYCVDGTEWISPGYFEEITMPYAREMVTTWQALGGFVVWHSCGHVARLVERGYYNELLPDIFETMSEQPYGNLPSLRWGREQLDPRIATKGNIDLHLLQNGPEEEIRAEVRRVKSETTGYRHIIGASDDVLHGTPLGSLRAFVDEARKG
jgi:hypothetical protein